MANYKGHVKAHLYYLDAQFKDVDEAGASRNESGGSCSDSIPVMYEIRDGRQDFADYGSNEDLDRTGFTLAKMTDSEAKAAKAVDPMKLDGDATAEAAYYRAMETLVQRITGCTYCQAFHFALRDSSIIGVHTRPMGDNAPRGPINNVHCDFTPNSPGLKQIRELVAQMGMGNCRFTVVNAWRNTADMPVSQWPMACCDVTTVSQAQDLVPRITPDNGNAIYHMLPNPAHKWYSYSMMTSDEVLIFKQYDTEPGKSKFTPHTAFTLPNDPEGAPARESCEVRVLCIYADPVTHGPVLQQLRESGKGLVAPQCSQPDALRARL